MLLRYVGREKEEEEFIFFTSHNKQYQHKINLRLLEIRHLRQRYKHQTLEWIDKGHID